MSTERDTTRIVRSWLRTEENESADRVLGTVLDRLDTTPQRRATWWPVRRTSTMNKIVGFSLAAAAVVVVIVVGAQLFGSAGGLGAGPTPIPEPPVAEPTATPEPSPSSAADLEGPFVLSEEPAITVTFAAPGWSRENNLQIPAKHGSYFPPDGAYMVGPWAGFDFYIPADPCEWRSTWPDAPATTLDEFVGAIASQASRDASEPMDVTVDGHPGKSITLHVPEDIGHSAGAFDCDEGKFCTFGDAGGCHMWNAQGPGAIDELWVVDLNGEIFAMTGAYYPETPADDVDELQAILGSMTFGE